MKIIDTHVHLGNIFDADWRVPLEERTPETTHPDKPNAYELMRFRNIYFGRLNYFFKPLVAGSARATARFSNVPNLLDSMKRSSIHSSVILPIEPFVGTDSILEACKKRPELIPFCSVHPKDRERKKKLARYMKSGCKGIKLHPVIQEVAPDDTATLELIEEAAPYQVPMLLHTGWGSIGKGSFGFVDHYGKILRSFPKVRFIFAHVGFYEPRSFLDALEDHGNVYVDISWQPEGIIRKAVSRLGENRILFGTDWPYALQRTSLELVSKVFAGKRSVLKRILHKNAEELLGVS